MSERIRYELLLTGLSLVMGGWLMIVYDSLRLLRLLIHHNSLFMGMEDFFYWIYAGGAVFMLLYEQNDRKLSVLCRSRCIFRYGGI